MASIISNLKEILQSSDSHEDDFDNDFIYWWDDVSDEEYVEQKSQSLGDTLNENLIFVLHVLIFVPLIPLVILAVNSNVYAASAFGLITIAAVAMSYLLIRNHYEVSSRIMDENVKLLVEKDLSGSEELLFSKVDYDILADFDEFRTALVELFRSYGQSSRDIIEEVERTRSTITHIHSKLDQINLSIENTVASTGTYQELKGYLSQVSSGVDFFTESFDRTLSSISETSNILRSIGKQTTMLALNAGIEAAKAGERGKGFEVVASNLRRLAQHATDSSMKLESETDEINEQARLALKNITTGMSALEGMVDVNHSELNDLNNEIYNTVQDINSVGREFGNIASIVEQNIDNLEKYRF